MTKNGLTVLERFWLHVNKDGKLVPGMDTNCWEWNIEAKKSRSISFKVDKFVVPIHLFSYRNFVGEILDGQLVLRKCKNLRCVRPDHLFLGTRCDANGKRYIDEQGIEVKICATCKKVFPYTDEYFYPSRHKSSTVDYISSCKTCAKEKVLANKEIYWDRMLWHGSKRDAQTRNIPFELQPEFVMELYTKQEGKCYWFGIHLIPSRIQKYPFKPSLDRLDRMKGYARDNVVLCCLAANMGRNSASEEDFKSFVLELQKGIDISLWR